MIAEAPIHADDCRALWLAILNQEVETALGRPLPCANTAREKERAVDDARNWIGGKDFREVCHYAGVEPEAVLRVYRQRIADPAHEPRRPSRHPGRHAKPQDRAA